MKHWTKDLESEPGGDMLPQLLEAAIEAALVSADRIPGAVTRLIEAEITAVDEEGIKFRRALVIGLNFYQCSPEIQVAAERLIELLQAGGEPCQ